MRLPQHGRIVPFTPRQGADMQQQELKPARGGDREPLPRLTITIPNFGRYQKSTRGRREWVRLQTATRHSRQVRQLTITHRWAFVVLLMLADNDGTIQGVTENDLATEIGFTNYRAAKNALAAMENVGLVQVGIKSGSSRDQVGIKSRKPEQSDNCAPLSATTIDNRQSTIDKKTKAKKPRFSVTQTSPDFQAFIARYPNATEVREAWDVWQEINPSGDLTQAIMAGLDRWLVSRRWVEGFVKAPFRWLRDAMFEQTPERAKAITATTADIDAEAARFEAEWGAM